jgi:adenine-specific DNA-methyltransferase
MVTDPGDLVFDPTCGSGTTAKAAETWGRRWITCDTSRVSLTIAKQRLMTSLFDYFELAYPSEGISSGLKYKIHKRTTLGAIANDEPTSDVAIVDNPSINNSKSRIAGPFTVEAVPAPYAKSFDELDQDDEEDIVTEEDSDDIIGITNS